jgi:hypothetical protein
MSSKTSFILDNPVWHALAALPTNLATKAAHAARFAAKVALFFAIDAHGIRISWRHFNAPT